MLTMDFNELRANLNDLKIGFLILGGTFDVDIKQLRVKDINSELEKETTWSNLELSQSLNKEKTSLEKFLDDFLLPNHL